MALPGINLQSDLVYLVRAVEVAQGVHPVRLDVKNNFNTLLATRTTGMRTLSANGVPIFIDTTLTTWHYNYYKPSAPYTAVDATY